MFKSTVFVQKLLSVDVVVVRPHRRHNSFPLSLAEDCYVLVVLLLHNIMYCYYIMCCYYITF